MVTNRTSVIAVMFFCGGALTTNTAVADESSVLSGESTSAEIQRRVEDGARTYSHFATGDAETYEPTLTIVVDADPHQSLAKQLTIPDNLSVQSDVAGWEVKGRATLPNRMLWHAEVVFDDKKPAADFENGVSTKVTL
ncbi:MAG: hypothetical protein ACYC3X_22910 [Pirellulaceae bacterium]